MAIEAIYFNGKLLSPEPSNMSLDSVVRLLQDGRPVYVCLEPGDWTRYELVILPVSQIYRQDPNQMGNAGASFGIPTWNASHRLFMVTRLVGGHPAQSTILSVNTFSWRGHLNDLGSNDEWTQEVFFWWFKVLLERLK